METTGSLIQTQKICPNSFRYETFQKLGFKRDMNTTLLGENDVSTSDLSAQGINLFECRRDARARDELRLRADCYLTRLRYRMSRHELHATNGTQETRTTCLNDFCGEWKANQSEFWCWMFPTDWLITTHQVNRTSGWGRTHHRRHLVLPDFHLHVTPLSCNMQMNSRGQCSTWWKLFPPLFHC